MNLGKYGRRAIAALFLLAALPASAAGRTERLDCSTDEFLGLKMGQMYVTIVDEVDTSTSLAAVSKLAPAICRSVMGALFATAGTDVWLATKLRVVLVENVTGGENASWDGSKADGQMQVALAVALAFTTNQLIFSFGHELGHAVLNHRTKDAPNEAAVVGGAAAGASAGRVVQKGLNAVGVQVPGLSLIGALGGGLVARKCSIGMHSRKNEFEADKFGMRVLYGGAGLPFDRAQRVVGSLLRGQQGERQGCMDAGGNPHPSPNERADAVDALVEPPSRVGM